MRRGFTIVELLIVIVVVGVLAAIVAVAYNGIQQRARNVKTIAAAEQWLEIFDVYMTRTGNTTIIYPASSMPADSVNVLRTLCIGSTTEYPATSDFTAGTCTNVSGSTQKRYVNMLVYNELMKVAGSTSHSWKDTLKDSGVQAGISRGIRYSTASTDPVNSVNPARTLWYELEGDTDCKLPKSEKHYGNGVTTCWVNTDLFIGLEQPGLPPTV